MTRRHGASARRTWAIWVTVLMIAIAVPSFSSFDPFSLFRPQVVRESSPFLARISDFAVVPYRQDQSPRLDFWGSDVRNLTTEGDTRWVNYNTSHFSSRSTAS